jgi:hypothetical protein
MPYVLPNRKAFADAITRIFLKYPRKPVDSGDKDEDLCLARGSTARELLPHQKIIRDYLLIETPYRGILVYHGLGSGKTCSAIAVAESLLTNKKVFVLSPAALEQNFRGELRKCGDPVYMYDQHWRERALTEESREEAKTLGISESFVNRMGKFYTTMPGETPNWNALPKSAQDIIAKQIEDQINQRFTFIHYDGLSSANINKYVNPDGPNPYDESVVIIDEVHNVIRRVTNASDIARKLYDRIYTARNCKVVALSGTPVINRAFEIAYLMNLLRGPIERITIPVKAIPNWDEERMKTALRKLPDVDTIEFNAVKKYILLTRNPPNFRSVYNEKGDRIAVQYVKDLPFTVSAKEWVDSWKVSMETEMGGAELATDRVTTETLNCLPMDQDEFASMFLDGLNIKNQILFQQRIQGLVSYFKGADERMLPRRVDDDKILEKCPMSNEQFNRYLEVRWKEIEQDSRQRRKPKTDEDDSMSTYRVNSRLVCNYAIPSELRKDDEDAASENEIPPKQQILAQLRASPQRYLSEQALATFSPKMLKMLQNIKESMGTETWNNQMIYSNYRELEGLGVFAAILDANGWQQYKIVKEGEQWVEDPSLDATKPAYAFFTGGSDSGQREWMRQIFNGSYADNFPPSLKASIQQRGKKLLTLFMISGAGAEGITLENVRRVHIMEPHWNPARTDQVMGRAIRICSHARLPMEERTVRISFYISTFTPEQSASTSATNVVAIRRGDTETKRYEGDPVEAFMSTDEYLYEISYEKNVTNSRISTLLKQAAVDCEIHRKFHSRETPVLTCMRFDTTVTGEDLAYKPNYRNDDLDASILRNMSRRQRRLQKVSIKQMIFMIDPDSKEVFDGGAFEDNQRLLRVGFLTSPTQIRWLPDTNYMVTAPS